MTMLNVHNVNLFHVKNYLHSRRQLTLYKYWLVPRSHWKIMPLSCAMLPEGQSCLSRLTVNICFVISRNKSNKFVSSSMTQQHRIRIELTNTVAGPKNRPKCMVSRGLPREHGSRNAMFPGTWCCIDETWQHCLLFLYITWCTLDQSWSHNSDCDITIVSYSSDKRKWRLVIVTVNDA